jgi:thymidylate kinase
MIIILEGPDGSGKTTLAQQISRQTGYLLLHRSQPKSEEDKKRMMDEYIQVIKANKNCIMDRSWYSEMVYGPVMRDDSVITYPQMYELERMLSKNGALLIYCTAPESVLWKRCLRRGEDYITKHEDFSQICKGFDELMYDVPHYIPVMTYECKEV